MEPVSLDVDGIQRVEAPDGSWEMVTRPPHPQLRHTVRRYVGYWENASTLVRRREVPIAGVPVVVSWGEPLRRIDGAGGKYRSFVAGMSARSVVVEHDGRQAGVEVVLTPVGASVVLAMPLGELTDQMVPLDAVLGGGAQQLTDRLAVAEDWRMRFAILDGALRRRLENGTQLPMPIIAAARRLAESGGRMRMDALAADVGWSRRHLARVFTELVGLPPKATAQIHRFERATELLTSAGSVGLANVAVVAGYADQSHFTREFRTMAGCTPGEWVAQTAG